MNCICHSRNILSGIWFKTISPIETFGDDKNGFSSEIDLILDRTRNTSNKEVEGIIEKAKSLNGLTPEETAILLQCNDKELTELLYSAAEEIKKAISGTGLSSLPPFISPAHALTTASTAVSEKRIRQ